MSLQEKSSHLSPQSAGSGGSRRDAAQELEDIMSENFLNLARDINLQIQDAEKTLNMISSNKYTLRHFIVKFLKTKGENKNLKVTT